MTVLCYELTEFQNGGRHDLHVLFDLALIG